MKSRERKYMLIKRLYKMGVRSYSGGKAGEYKKPEPIGGWQRNYGLLITQTGVKLPIKPEYANNNTRIWGQSE